MTSRKRTHRRASGRWDACTIRAGKNELALGELGIDPANGTMWNADPRRRTTGTPICPASRSRRGRRGVASRRCDRVRVRQAGGVRGVADAASPDGYSDRTACTTAGRRRPGGRRCAASGASERRGGVSVGVEGVGFQLAHGKRAVEIAVKGGGARGVVVGQAQLDRGFAAGGRWACKASWLLCRSSSGSQHLFVRSRRSR